MCSLLSLSTWIILNKHKLLELTQPPPKNSDSLLKAQFVPSTETFLVAVRLPGYKITFQLMLS